MATPGPDERAPGSLTEWLRTRTDDQLADLLRRRPDLALPAPADLSALAGRMAVRTSAQRAVDGLNAFTLRVLEALTLSSSGDSPADMAAAHGLLGSHVDAGDVDAALRELAALGLVWGEPPRLVTMVRESVGPYPAGLGRPAATLFAQVSDVQLAPVLRALGLPPASQPRAGAAAAEVFGDPARVRELVAGVDADERDVLERLAAGPPVGTVRNAFLAPSPGDPDAPAPLRLLGRGLLVAVDAQTVELPREIALAIRPDPLGAANVRPPAIEVVAHPPAQLDRTGTTAVLHML